MTTTTKARLRVVQQPPALSPLLDLENQICDLDRAARIAFLMTMRDLESDEGDDLLGLFAVEQVERLAKELRDAFNNATAGKAVRT